MFKVTTSAATHILQEKTHACGVLKRHNFRVHVSLGSAETLVRRGGITNHHSIAYSLSNISAKNYRNRLMWVESIVCSISVVFLRHIVYVAIPMASLSSVTSVRYCKALSVVSCVCVWAVYCIRSQLTYLTTFLLITFMHFCSRYIRRTEQREHWIQRITFAAETNAARSRCVV